MVMGRSERRGRGVGKRERGIVGTKKKVKGREN